MSEFNIVNESINDKGRYRAARAAKKHDNKCGNANSAIW